jgi:glycosyltransferase involved in cell wall biosynthesis
VSVIIRTYNQRDLIGQAIDGALGQRTSFPYEIIVGDDCSSDGTREVVEEYADRHPAIVRAFLPGERLGQDGLRMFAALLDSSTAQFVAPIDGDDYWTDPRKLERCVALLDSDPSLSMCFHNMVCRSDRGGDADEPFNRPDQPAESGIDQLLRSCYIAASSPVIRREAIVPLPEWYFRSTSNDWPLYMLACRSGRIGYLPECMGVYRVWDEGLYHRLDRAARIRMCVGVFEALDGGLFSSDDAVFQSRRAEEWLGLSEECARVGEVREARRAARMALRAAPRLLDPIGRASVRALIHSLVLRERSRSEVAA